MPKNVTYLQQSDIAMGAVITLLKDVVAFFKNIALLGVQIAKLLPKLIAHPFEVILQIILIGVGMVAYVVLKVWWTLGKMLSVPLFGALATYLTYIASVWESLLVLGIWAVYLAITAVVFLVDFFTAGYGFRLFLCEDELDAWAMRGNFANGNTCSKLLLCARPCGNRYAPAFGGAVCSRNTSLQPALCPQQFVYRKHMAGADAEYSSRIGADAMGGNHVFPDDLSGQAETPVFQMMNKNSKRAYVRDAYGKRLNFLRNCDANMAPYEPIARHLCANADLMFADSPDIGQVKEACAQAYCDSKVVKGSKGGPDVVTAVQPWEKPRFCTTLRKTTSAAPKYVPDDVSSVFKKAALGTVGVVFLYVVISTAQKARARAGVAPSIRQ